ncbi:MAG: hypothetical protein ACKO7W_00685 [Elainella sp.]
MPPKLSTGLLLSFSTAPFLLLLLGGRALSVLLLELGQTSEELFRGERLPVLKISAPVVED